MEYLTLLIVPVAFTWFFAPFVCIVFSRYA